MSWSRREFLALSSLAVIGGILPGRASAAVGGARAGVLRMDRFTPLRRNVGIYENRGGVVGWFVTPDGVAVVDSQYADTAPVFAEGLRGRTSRGIDILLNTHHHGDHVGGNAVLRPMAEQVVAHAHAATLLRGNENFPAEGRPDTTFDTEWSVALADESIRAKHYGRAHTGGDATVFFRHANVVHMGDLMFNRTYPFIDGSSGGSVRGWVEVLESVLGDHDADTIYIFGHAAEGFPFTGEASDLAVQRDFLSEALDRAERGRREGLTVEQLVAGGPPEGFPQHTGPENRLTALYTVAFADLEG